MDPHRFALSVALSAPDSPERDSALIALAAAARAEGLLGSAVLDVLASALRGDEARRRGYLVENGHATAFDPGV